MPSESLAYIGQILQNLYFSTKYLLFFFGTSYFLHFKVEQYTNCLNSSFSIPQNELYK